MRINWLSLGEPTVFSWMNYILYVYLWNWLCGRSICLGKLWIQGIADGGVIPFQANKGKKQKAKTGN
jgi:hypothetical protein